GDPGRQAPPNMPGAVQVGRVDDGSLADLYSAAGCLVFPSRYEGFGLPCLEAMACGCPVAAFRNTSLPEVVDEVGRLVEDVERNAKARRLAFTTSYADAVPGAEYAIIAVSTPEGEGGEADLSYVEAAASSIADAMDGPLVVVNKSTVPPLTGDMVSAVLKRRNGEFAATVVSNPEFLREGSAIQDFMHPDRIVVGSHDRDAAEKVAMLYAPLEAPILITPNIYTAEMVKYASN